MAVVIETTIGDLTVDLFLKERPRACLNFLKLCKLKYYNYNLFHTIENGFIGQTGDPTGVGDGGESIWGVIEGPDKRFFEAEYLPKIRHSDPGLLSMVSLGNNLIGSQFFLTLGTDLTSLDGIHCVIGQVTEGFDVLRALNEAICDNTHRPYKDIRITHTVILEDPFENPRGFREPSRSPSPSTERLQGGRIGADEEIDDSTGRTDQEIKEMIETREAKARATILEIVGDLPDADVAPPENVLFICKLNSVTTDDDLEIIFSRFGKVKGCEVIRDRVTGDSLQYAFVEFEERKSCEAAFFKMDNVLIDDRRIHVDFSQSVSRVQWRGKGRGLVIKDGSKNNRIDFSNYKDGGDRNKSGRKSPNRFSRNDQRDRRPENGNRDKDRRERRNSRSPVRDQVNRFRRNSPRQFPRNNFRRSPKRNYNQRRSRSRSPQRQNRRSPRRNYRDSRRSRSGSPRRNNRDNKKPRSISPRRESRDDRPQRPRSKSPRRNNQDNRETSRYQRVERSSSRSREDRRNQGRNERRNDERLPGSSSLNRSRTDDSGENGFRKKEGLDSISIRKPKRDRSASSCSSDSSAKKKSKKSKKSKKYKHQSSESDAEKKHKKSKKKKDKKSKKSKSKSKRKSSSCSNSDDSNSS